MTKSSKQRSSEKKTRRREAIERTVRRNASGSVQASAGKFVTPQDKSLSKLDIE